jgi:hypothetical protein
MIISKASIWLVYLSVSSIRRLLFTDLVIPVVNWISGLAFPSGREMSNLEIMLAMANIMEVSAKCTPVIDRSATSKRSYINLYQGKYDVRIRKQIPEVQVDVYQKPKGLSYSNPLLA